MKTALCKDMTTLHDEPRKPRKKDDVFASVVALLLSATKHNGYGVCRRVASSAGTNELVSNEGGRSVRAADVDEGLWWPTLAWAAAMGVVERDPLPPRSAISVFVVAGLFKERLPVVTEDSSL